MHNMPPPSPFIISPISSGSTNLVPQCPNAFCDHCIKYAPQLIKMSALITVFAVGSYPTALGVFEEFAFDFLNQGVRIALSVTGGSIAFKQFLNAYLSLEKNFRNPPSTDTLTVATSNDFKKNMAATLLLSICYSASSALFTAEQISSPLGWTITAAALNFLANEPFAIENTLLVTKSLARFRGLWSEYTCCQKITLILTLFFIMFCVSCVLIIYVGPAARLVMSHIPTPYLNMIMAIIFSILSVTAEGSFQGMQMLLLEPGHPQQLFGFFRNPFPDDARNHKIRTIISVLLASILAASNKFYTTQEILSYNIEHGELLAEIAGWFAAFTVEYSGIRPADEVITQPIVHGISTALSVMYDKIPERIKQRIAQMSSYVSNVPASRNGYTRL